MRYMVAVVIMLGFFDIVFTASTQLHVGTWAFEVNPLIRAGGWPALFVFAGGAWMIVTYMCILGLEYESKFCGFALWFFCTIKLLAVASHPLIWATGSVILLPEPTTRELITTLIGLGVWTTLITLFALKAKNQ